MRSSRRSKDGGAGEPRGSRKCRFESQVQPGFLTRIRKPTVASVVAGSTSVIPELTGTGRRGSFGRRSL